MGSIKDALDDTRYERMESRYRDLCRSHAQQFNGNPDYELIHGKYHMGKTCEHGKRLTLHCLKCYPPEPIEVPAEKFKATPMGRRRKVYIIGSLRNPAIPAVAKHLRDALPGVEVFDDWYAAGPEADDHWKAYELARGRTYIEALAGHAARNVFAFDKRNLEDATDVVLVLPAGKSGHLELGYCAGKGKHTFVLLDDPDRWDVMYQFATAVVSDVDDLVDKINAV